MPRIPRGLFDGGIFHILSRANDRRQLFFNAFDYAAFIGTFLEALTQYAVLPFAFCVMPNHFHLVAQVPSVEVMGDFMQWWLVKHARQYHAVKGTIGHLWASRYKSFPVQDNAYLNTVLRYVLLNPVRAHLVPDAAAWPWSSLHYRDYLAPLPPSVAADWESTISDGLRPEELLKIQECIRLGRPFGEANWVTEVTRRAGIRVPGPRGRPRRVVVLG